MYLRGVEWEKYRSGRAFGLRGILLKNYVQMMLIS